MKEISGPVVHAEKLLTELLEMKEALLGEDLLFELQGLLTDKTGCNFRDEFAHGLMSSQTFLSPPAIYLWW